jgi:hypothetical protein
MFWPRLVDYGGVASPFTSQNMARDTRYCFGVTSDGMQCNIEMRILR